MAVRNPEGRPVTIIAAYNYKGGVGKTTIVVNLAAMLATHGKKTLIVDCDPQCNATDFYLSPAKMEDEDEEEDGAEEIAEEQGLAMKILCDKVRDNTNPAMTDLNAVRGQYSPTVYDHLAMALTGADASALELKPVHTIQDLWILPGDTRLIELDEIFSDASKFRRSIDVFQNLGGFRFHLKELARNHKFEYILVDLGPSSSAMNMIFALNSDYILPLVFADFFSLSALDGFLNTLMPNWLAFIEKYHHYAAERTGNKLAEKYRFASPTPTILPFIVSNYKMYKKNVMNNYAKWSVALDFFIYNNVRNPKVMALFLFDGTNPMLINFCKDLSSSMRISQSLKKPVWMISNDDYRRVTGNNAALDTKKIWAYAKRRYESLGDFIQNLPTGSMA